jgi:hypothetical protein
MNFLLIGGALAGVGANSGCWVVAFAGLRSASLHIICDDTKNITSKSLETIPF